jgi:hypothetical protein
VPLSSLLASSSTSASSARSALGLFGEDQAELGEHAADAVDASGAFFLESFAYSVQAHDALLLGRLDRHEAHARPRGCFADRRGIGGVVLAATAFPCGTASRSWPR